MGLEILQCDAYTSLLFWIVGAMVVDVRMSMWFRKGINAVQVARALGEGRGLHAEDPVGVPPHIRHQPQHRSCPRNATPATPIIFWSLFSDRPKNIPYFHF